MENNRFYTVKDVLKKVGITRPTLYKWFREQKVPEVIRDRNNFRLFTEKDINRILVYKNVLRKPKLNNVNKYKNKI